MHLPRPAAALFLTTLCLIFANVPPLVSAAGLDKVSVSAEVKTAPHGAESRDHESQGRMLVINVNNTSHEDLKNLKVKWTFFGFDLKDNAVVVAESGVSKQSLPPSGTATITTKAVVFNFTRTHAQPVKGAPNQPAKSKKVEASGSRYDGWAVQVYQVDGVVGEAFSRPDLKDKL